MAMGFVMYCGESSHTLKFFSRKIFDNMHVMVLNYNTVLDNFILIIIMYESNPTTIRPPPGNLTFEKIIGQMPARTGRNHSQMPCYRGCPGSGILAKIKLNKYFKIKKNEK